MVGSVSAVSLGRQEGTPVSEPSGPIEQRPIKLEPSRELSREELLRRARPAPPRSETAIEDLTSDEWDTFLAAIRR